MKNLIDDWNILKGTLAGKHVALFLDYDGTLAPIASTPQLAIMSQETKDVLQSIVNIPQCSLIIISGRSLADVKKKIGVKGIIYVGNHGLEIKGPGIKFESMAPQRTKEILSFLKDKIAVQLTKYPGSFIEDKELTLSIHYRLLAKDKVGPLLRAIKKIVKPYTIQGEIRVESGKMVIEIKPAVEWDKGKAASWILTSQVFTYAGNVFPVCIGDDMTDEHAFREVKGKGWGVHVGDSKVSHAEYYLRSTYEVVNLLKLIYRLKKDEKIIKS